MLSYLLLYKTFFDFSLDHFFVKLKLNLHFSYRSQTDVVRKVQQYAELGAEDLMAKKRKIGILTPPYHGVWAFMKTFLFRLGILDGKVGWRIAQMNAQTTYKKYQLARERLIRLRK